MPARKKVIKRKSGKSAPRKKSKFSIKKILAPFLVLVGVVLVLSFTLIPKSEVLSLQTASDSYVFGQAIKTTSEKGISNFVQMGGESIVKLLPNGDFTAEAWVNPGQTGNSESAILSYGKVGTSRPFWISMLKSTLDDGTPRIGFIFASPGLVNGKCLNLTSGYAFMPQAPGKWMHIAGVIKGGQRMLYINGVNVSSNKTISSASCNNTTPAIFTVGIDTVNGSVEGYTGFTGLIDEVRISNVARYSGVNIPVQKAPFVDDKYTLGLWHFDNNFNDFSVNKLTGVSAQNSGYPKVGFVPSTINMQSSSLSPTPTYISTTLYPTKIPTTPTPTYASPSLYPTKTPAPTTAYITPTSTGKLCPAKLSYVNTKTACRPFKSDSTTGATFGCSDGYVGVKTGTTCTSAAAWYSIALRECSSRLTACK